MAINTNYDVAIIGAGPAGLMAAIRASKLGARVVLIEKNKRPGIKLLLTGGGRCNITHYGLTPKIFSEYFGLNGRFLISALNKFGADEVIDFFENNNLKTKIEKESHVFPQSDKAQDVLNVLLRQLKDNKVDFKTDVTLKKIISSENKITKLILESGESVSAKNYILACGGKSYPETGSNGEVYKLLEDLGHNIIPLRPALAPIYFKEKFVKDIEGLSVSRGGLSLFKDDKKIINILGDFIFTEKGISGPAAFSLSRYLNSSPNKYQVVLDLFPEIVPLDLDKKLQKIINDNSNKLFRNSLDGLIAPKLVPQILKLARINPEKKSNEISREERKTFIGLLKSLSFNISGLGGFDKALVTAGGVDLKEVDPKTMQSKIISNLYLAGEILDLDGPTGGYNLQAAWSTGYVAGENAVN